MIAKCLILHIGMASAMNQSCEPQARQAKPRKRQTQTGRAKMATIQTVAVISQFRKAPVWMLVVKTTFNGSTFTHIGVDTRKGVVAK